MLSEKGEIWPETGPCADTGRMSLTTWQELALHPSKSHPASTLSLDETINFYCLEPPSLHCNCVRAALGNLHTQDKALAKDKCDPKLGPLKADSSYFCLSLWLSCLTE